METKVQVAIEVAITICGVANINTITMMAMGRLLIGGKISINLMSDK